MAGPTLCHLCIVQRFETLEHSKCGVGLSESGIRLAMVCLPLFGALLHSLRQGFRAQALGASHRVRSSDDERYLTFSHSVTCFYLYFGIVTSKIVQVPAALWRDNRSS